MQKQVQKENENFQTAIKQKRLVFSAHVYSRKNEQVGGKIENKGIEEWNEKGGRNSQGC